MMRTIALLVLLSAACEDPEVTAEKRRQEYIRIVNSTACVETATLVATTAGSPNSALCMHRQHKARVEAATKAGEEIGAVVFCECQKP